MYSPLLKLTPRGEYRDQQTQRVNSAPTLADKFPGLKALAMELAHYTPEGTTRNSRIKFTPNLATARTVFRIDCPNQSCVGGDFELSDVLAQAVAAKRTVVSGECCCQGWQSRTSINTAHCHNVLRYTLRLTYA